METLIVQPKTQKQLAAIKAVLKALDVSFKKEEEDSYDPEFVEKIKSSIQQVNEGKGTVLINEADFDRYFKSL